MKLLTVTAIAGLMIAFSAHSQSTPAQIIPSPPLAVKPIARTPEAEKHRYDAALYVPASWLPPSGDVASDYFPAQALNDEIEGAAKVDCLIAPDGKVTACEVVYENPLGYGFGEATRQMVEKHFRIDPTSVPGGIPAGARKELSYKWLL